MQTVQRQLDRRASSDASETRLPVGARMLVHVAQLFVRKTGPQSIRGRVHATKQTSVGETRYTVVTPGGVLGPDSLPANISDGSACVSFSSDELRCMEQAEADSAVVPVRGAAQPQRTTGSASLCAW